MARVYLPSLDVLALETLSFFLSPKCDAVGYSCWWALGCRASIIAAFFLPPQILNAAFQARTASR
jgi:hypothetical protein